MQNLLQTLWAVIGLFLTTGATFLQGYIIGGNLAIQPINVSLQIGAVLLTGCVGGKNAGMFAQVMYLFLGLTDYGVFFQGGGINYWRSPAFGFLLGFVPAGYLCGFLAFKGKGKVTLTQLTLICTLGLIVIHLVGAIYLILLGLLTGTSDDPFPFAENLMQYSVQKIPGQFLIVCTTALLSYLLRLILLY
ncbi:biotin transporter BioY [Synechococcus sp. PCC 7502]|uniref:biotin transporter BioY n=1 Tax=Synechococcus sp. PCC 7502 TaxID=1173263 RepID=UPI0002E9FF0B|nr:biotin transporter BioY [Synechococcus sp. PCC 7502]